MNLTPFPSLSGCQLKLEMMSILKQLLEEWANEGNGQCLGSDVEYIVFHAGRYSLDAGAKEWAKHHHKLHTPSSFRCPQKTLTGHVGHSTFVLRGIVAHQGPELISGHYVAMLAAGDAVWVVDDGESCAGAHPARSSHEEHSTFWTHTVGRFDPPAKRSRTGGDSVEVFYGNVTQWNRDAKDWLLQQDLQLALLVETHVTGKKLETAAHELARSKGRSKPWRPMRQAVEAPVAATSSAAERVKQLQDSPF